MAKLTTDNGIVTKYSGNITELVIPDGISEISDPKSYGDKGVFEGHVELTKVILPEGLIRIGESAFDGCTGLTNIVIPNSVREIGKYAFRGCSGLSEITLSENLTNIDREAFCGCSGLTSLSIPENVTSIGYGAFSGCSKLVKVSLPNSDMDIQNSAFEDCNGLTSITFPENNIKLGSYTFRNCEGLIDVTIPESVKYYSDTFLGCKNIKINGEDLLIKDSVLQNYAGSSTEVIIPEGVKTVGRGAFESHPEIISITIPGSVTKIESSAFKGCSGLTNISIPNSVTEIGSSAFADCSSLKSIIIPDSVNIIEADLFRNCTNLTNITIPNNVLNFKLSSIQGCDSLCEISIPASVKVLDCGYSWKQPKNLKRILVAPDSGIESVWGSEELLDFEISPIPNIPFSVFSKPEDKIKFFFEYCKNPELYPKQIAEEYEKYGKSQRSRILKAAEANNKTEVIAYFEEKGHKVAERTLSPEEKAALLSETIDSGSNDDLIKILTKYKNFINGSEMLEKTVIQGDFEKTRTLVNGGIDFPEGTSCFIDLFESKTISTEIKIDICSFCISNRTLNTPVHGIVFLACVFGYDEIISTWKTFKEENEFLKLDFGYLNWRYYGTFGSLSESECMNSLQSLLQLSDPNRKTELPLENMKGPEFFHLQPIKFVLEHFSVDSYGALIYGTVCNQDIVTLQFLSDYLREKLPILYDERNYQYFLGRAVKSIIDKKSKEMLELIVSAGWIINFSNTLNEELITQSIKSGDSELLKILVSNELTSKLPSSFSKLEALRTSVRADNPGALALLSEQGWIRTAANRDTLIELASNEKKNNALAWLLEYKNKTAKPEKEEKAREKKERKELESSEVKLESTSSINEKSWKTGKNADGTYKIERYLGTEYNLTIPAIIGKRKITTIGKRSFAPDSYYSMRKENIFWSGKKTTAVVSDGITTVEDEAFYEFSDLIAIELPGSVTTIGSNAFSGCDKLENVIISDNVTEISDDTFSYCRKLKKITIPEGVVKIGDRAFYGCASLTDVTISESVREFGWNIFGGFSSKEFVLHVHKDSPAMQYAINNNLNYEVIEK